MLQSPWIKGFAALAFIAECIGLIFAGGQNPQMFKKFLPLLVGTVLFMCAGKIVDLVFGSSWDDVAPSMGSFLMDEQRPATPTMDSETLGLEFV